jgi:hypothetical protein
MDLKIFNKCNIRELTYEEERCINGGSPDKETSFWYDVSYFFGHLAAGVVKEGIFTKGWWEDLSITWSS